jgi:hypothetical protein
MRGDTMTYKKQVVENKVRKIDNKKHVIEAHSADEEEIVIIIKNDTDVNRVNKIQKLSTVGLPASGAGVSNIIWINNFRLKDDKDKDVDVPYKLQLKQKAGKTLVYHNGAAVLEYSGPVAQIGDGMIEIQLSLGDPGTGWGTKG